MDPLFIAVLVLIGFFVGAIGTLVGAGGGFLVVPILLIGYGFSPKIAVGTSLVVVFMNALSGTIAYVKQKRIDYYLGIRFGAATIPGAILGAIAANYITSPLFHISFGILLIVVAILVASGKNEVLNGKIGEGQSSAGAKHTYKMDVRIGMALSCVVGFLSSLFGIGGGVVHVPFMIAGMGIPTHIATATSHFILVGTSLAGVGMMASLLNIDYLFAITIGIGALFGAQAGAHLSKRTKGRTIAILLSIALIIVAIRLIFEGFYAG